MSYMPDEQALTDQVVAFIDAHDPLLVLPHVYLWAWESDVLAVDQNRRVSEYEIKTGRTDFLNDREKHYGAGSKSELLDGPGYGPNHFWYVVTTPVYRRIFNDLPDYAGLMVARKQGSLEVVREAPLLNEQPIADHRLMQLYRKGYERCRRLEQQNRELNDRIHLLNRHFTEERKSWQQNAQYDLHETIRRQDELIRDLYAAVESLKRGSEGDEFVEMHLKRAYQYLNKSNSNRIYHHPEDK